MKLVFFLFILLSFFYVNCKLPFFNLIPHTKKLSSEQNITYIYGHLNPDTDAIASAIVLADFLKQMGSKNLIVPCRLGELNKETKFALEYFNISEPRLITDPTEADEVILVDHNDPAQSIKFKQAKIVALIDHHAITDFYTKDPINIITKPIGCTCTILYQLYKSNNLEIPNKIQGLIASAIISDTLLLNSAITTQEDRDVIANLSASIPLNLNIFGKELLTRGADVSDLTEEQIINLDSKAYEVNGYKIQIAFLNSVDVDGLLTKRKRKLLAEMDKFVKENKKQFFTLVIVDIFQLNSTALVGGEYYNAIEKAFNVKLDDNEVFLKGITSRKKEVYPRLAEYFNSLPEYYDDDDDDDDDKNIATNIKINWILICFLLYLLKY